MAKSRLKGGAAVAPLSTLASLPESWPANHVEARRLAELVPAARNARTHTKAQVEKIAASIGQWGWTNPVLVDEAGGIIAGHGRVLAADLLGLEAVPVVVARGWTEAQRRAYLIADNQLALDAGWDLGMLSAELGELQALDFDLALTGFDEEEVQGLLDSGGAAERPSRDVSAMLRGQQRVAALRYHAARVHALAERLFKDRSLEAFERAFARERTAYEKDLSEVEAGRRAPRQAKFGGASIDGGGR